MSDGEPETMRIQVKRNPKKKAAFEVELRDDGYYYITSVPSKKSSIRPGDRLIEVNGVKDADFKNAKRAKELFDTLIIDIVPNDAEEPEEESDEEESEVEVESGEDSDLD
jgi:predicted metalloprotease with PDZ domain